MIKSKKALPFCSKIKLHKKPKKFMKNKNWNSKIYKNNNKKLQKKWNNMKITKLNK